MQITINQVAARLNVTRPLCHALFGHNHKHCHRMAAGVVVMGIGVTVAKFAGHVEYQAIAFIGDGVGYAIHGLGLTPFLEFLLEKFAD
jgi:hypothetical protein